MRTPANDDRTAERRRFVTILIIFIIFITFDSQPDQLNGLRGGKLVRLPPPGPSEEEVQALSGLQSFVNNIPDPIHPFPTNVSGIYAGTWQFFPRNETINGFKPPVQVLSSEAELGKDGKDSPLEEANDVEKIAKSLRMQNIDGKLKLHVKSMKTEVNGIHLVLGILSFRDGQSVTSRDIVSVYSGAYILKTGTLTMFANDQERDRFLAVSFSERSIAEAAPLKNSTVWDSGGLLSDDDFKRLKEERSRQRQHTPTPKECKFRIDMQFSPSMNVTNATSVDQVDILTNVVDGNLEQSGTGQGKTLIEPSLWNGFATSLNCNAQMKVEAHALNLDIPGAIRKASVYSFLDLAMTTVQAWFIITQLGRASSGPASAAKVSPITIGALALSDWYLCLLYITSGVALDRLSNAFTPVALFKLVLSSVLEMRYLSVVWRARNPRSPDENWADSIRREMSTLYGRFYAAFATGLFLVWMLWSYHSILVMGAFSFWIPQIVQNVVDDERSALPRRFVVGMTLSRAFVPMYFFGCPRNFLTLIMEENTSMYEPQVVGWLVFWLGMQVGVLEVQRTFGPRSFIPKRFLPKKYDYFRAMPETLSHRDCVICMNPVVVTDSLPYMVTPCNHLFHQGCLQQWMEIKRDCPTCRTALPNP